MRWARGLLAVLVVATGFTVGAPATDAEAYKTSWYVVWRDSQTTGSGCGWLGCYITYRAYTGWGQDRGASVTDETVLVGTHGQAEYTWTWSETRSRIDHRDCTSFISGANAGKQYCGGWVIGTVGRWAKVRNFVSVRGTLNFVDGSGTQLLEIGSCSKSASVSQAFVWLKCTHRAIQPGNAKSLTLRLVGNLRTADGTRYDYGGTRTLERPRP